MGYSQGGGGHSYRGSFLLLPRGSQACPAPLLASGRVTLAYESHVPGGGGHNQERSCRVKGILDGIVPQGSGFCHDHRTPPPKKKMEQSVLQDKWHLNLSPAGPLPRLCLLPGHSSPFSAVPTPTTCPCPPPTPPFRPGDWDSSFNSHQPINREQSRFTCTPTSVAR